MRDESDLQRLAWAFQDIADEQRERARQERSLACETQNAMGITIKMKDISEMWTLLDRCFRSGIPNGDLMRDVGAFLYRHKPVPVPPQVFFKREDSEDE